jgi:uncharacterized Tic20 family protein
VKLTTHLHLVPSSKKVELYLHSHNTSSRRGAHLKHRDNFTFTIVVVVVVVVVLIIIIIIIIIISILVAVVGMDRCRTNSQVSCI